MTHGKPREAWALSLKQPWATLLVHGLKTIEIRSWSTPRRGPLLIHAARVADSRPEVWNRVPQALLPETRKLGGLIGLAELGDCRVYRTPEQFAADAPRHLNDPHWFRPPRLYGFVFAQARVVPFTPLAGWMRIFAVPGHEGLLP